MPHRELERLQAVHRFLNLNVDKDQNLQEIVELAAALCEMPIAFITMVGEKTRYFTFNADIDDAEYIINNPFFTNLTGDSELLIIPDTVNDSRFTEQCNPLRIRFYAGVPLTTHDGHYLGCLCLLDTKPNTLTDAQKKILTVFGKRIIQMMEFEFSVKILKEQYLQAKDTEIKLRSFFESGNSCHLLIGKELEIIAFNKNMAAFIDRIYHVQLKAGVLVSNILGPAALEQFTAEYKLALTGTSIQYEREVKYPEETIWWYVTFEPGYDQDGEIIGISYNAYDITERKLHEQQIVSQNESFKRIAHIQSHEFRRPVASILGLMEIIRTNNYNASDEELKLMEHAVKELDDKIREIVGITG